MKKFIITMSEEPFQMMNATSLDKFLLEKYSTLLYLGDDLNFESNENLKIVKDFAG